MLSPLDDIIALSLLISTNIRFKTAFFKSLGIDTKLSDYTNLYEGTAEEIAKRFTDRGWLGLGEHQSITPEKVKKIVKMAY